MLCVWLRCTLWVEPTRSSRVWQSPAKRLAMPALPASSLQTCLTSSRVALGLSFMTYLQAAGCAGGKGQGAGGVARGVIVGQAGCCSWPTAVHAGEDTAGASMSPGEGSARGATWRVSDC